MATTRAVEVIKKKILMTAPTEKEPPNAFPNLSPNVSAAVTRGRNMNLLKIKQKVIHILLSARFLKISYIKADCFFKINFDYEVVLEKKRNV